MHSDLVVSSCLKGDGDALGVLGAGRGVAVGEVGLDFETGGVVGCEYEGVVLAVFGGYGAFPVAGELLLIC